MKFKERIRALRLAKGWNYPQTVQKIKEMNPTSRINKVALSRWEMTDQLPTLENVIILAKVYGVSVDYLTADIEAVEKVHLINLHSKTWGVIMSEATRKGIIFEDFYRIGLFLILGANLQNELGLSGVGKFLQLAEIFEQLEEKEEEETKELRKFWLSFVSAYSKSSKNSKG